MLEPFDSDGVFWLPGQPEERIAGRLTYDSAKGGHLKLIGSFADTSQAFGNTDDYHRILGISGRKQVTLEDCFQTTFGFDMPGFVRQEFLVGRVIAGAHFDADEELAFDAVAVSL